MTKSEYRKYIQSEAWQQRRKAFLLGHNRCYLCDCPRWLSQLVYDQDLHVHHRSYAHVGEELDQELLPLCPRCHDIETFGRSDRREIPAHGCGMCCATMFDPYRDVCELCEATASDDERAAYARGKAVIR